MCEIEYVEELEERVKAGKWLRRISKTALSNRHDRQISIDTPERSADIRISQHEMNEMGAASRYVTFLSLSLACACRMSVKLSLLFTSPIVMYCPIGSHL